MSHTFRARLGRNRSFLRSFEERLGVTVFLLALLFVSAQAVFAHEFRV
ncbi:copper chaperone PCu(A)C, partial [Mesorhizobium sp. M5C.F.Ca.IN.020.32.2.1]